MSSITNIAGQGIPLIGNDIDTDRIIPARFLRCITFDGLGEYVFADDRNGSHSFDNPAFAGANILVVNRNFGCGSSREHAPQAIARWGIKAIIGESFAEIFIGNCAAIGLPCLTANTEAVEALQNRLLRNPATQISVDIESLDIHYDDIVVHGNLDHGPRQTFLTGTWDACGQLLAQKSAIQATAAKLPYLQFG
ncbi:MAG: 3-isopropylmalate dehydratase small subunit [Anaerolineae bacterium]|nr:3-isopropylmalate dehydratase small subunit [Gloeobacterales cyanobacterium ES-bin-313]